MVISEVFIPVNLYTASKKKTLAPRFGPDSKDTCDMRIVVESDLESCPSVCIRINHLLPRD